jgi:hypothetical protein
MAARDVSTIKRIQDLIEAGKSNCFWEGDSLPAIVAAISTLDLELSSNGRYLFAKRGKTLQISEESTGIIRYKTNGSAQDVEIGSESINITLGGVKGIGCVSLLIAPRDIPSNAKSFTHLDGPVDLLEEYAELYAKRQQNGLTTDENDRFNKLVTLIGKGYEQSRPSLVSIPSSRSTPVSSGESRGYSSGSSSPG